jgi:hypothetical protein
MRISLSVLICIIVVAGCSKDKNDRPRDNNHKPGIEIKGKISAVKSSGNSLADAKRIMVFNSLQQTAAMNVSITEIVADTFVADCKIGQAVALVFLDGNNHYIGTLSSRGLSVFPLCSMPQGDSSTINLSTLSLVGTSVIPSHDPLGAEISMDEEDVNSLKAVDGFYEYMAKNIDADNDGNLDFMSDKQIIVCSQFGMIGGKFGLNEQPAIIADTALNTFAGNTYITGGRGFTKPATASLSGPAENPYDQINLGFIMDLDNNQGFNIGFQTDTKLFREGTYTLTLDNMPYTVAFSTIDDMSKVVFIKPHLTTNEQGKLVSISFDFTHADNEPINPDIFLTGFMVQVVDSSLTVIYESPWVKSKYEQQQGNSLQGFNSVLTVDPPVDLSKLKNLNISYLDLLGNTYYSNWYGK